VGTQFALLQPAAFHLIRQMIEEKPGGINPFEFELLFSSHYFWWWWVLD
jgi:hypothetical protein